jgi:hypothetical protein
MRGPERPGPRLILERGGTGGAVAIGMRRAQGHVCFTSNSYLAFKGAMCHLLTCCRMLIDVQSGAKLDGTGDC